MEGLALLRELVAATGLPEAAVDRELRRILEMRGQKPEQLTLDDVRDVLAHYLQEVLLSAKTSINQMI